MYTPTTVFLCLVALIFSLTDTFSKHIEGRLRSYPDYMCIITRLGVTRAKPVTAGNGKMLAQKRTGRPSSGPFYADQYAHHV